MGIFKKIWHWLFPKTNEELIKEYSKIEDNNEKALKAQEIYNKVTRERDSEDNFLMGAMVGYVIAASWNDNTTHRDVEEIKSSNYESSYTPGSSSSYDSGSYSSSYDSGSSSSSCDSGY